MADAKSEAYELNMLGAIPTKNSGRGKHEKGDGILIPFCVDIKEAIKSFNLNRNVWLKIASDALQTNRLRPLLKVVIGEPGKDRIRLVIVEETMFKEMHEAWKEKYDA